MTEVVAKAFLSYAHRDNEREQGRILNLAKLIREEFETLTGATIDIFTDSAQILWGDDFRDKLNEALQETTFFIPILTPTYFLRDECRNEMRQFVTSASSLGLDQLLLSIRYVPVAGMVENSPDELKAIAARMQYVPWDDLRILDESSAAHRGRVNELAERLVKLTDRLEQSGSETKKPAGRVEGALLATPMSPTEGDSHARASAGSAVSEGLTDYMDDDAPGLIDQVADLQGSMAGFARDLTGLPVAVNAFNLLFQASAKEMDQANQKPNPFAAKILIAKKLARDVEPHLAKIEELSKGYVSGSLSIDGGVRAVLTMASSQEPSPDTEKTLDDLQRLIDTALEMSENVGSAADAARKYAGLSRDLRPVLRRFETAMRNIVDGTATFTAWQPLVDAARAS